MIQLPSKTSRDRFVLAGVMSGRLDFDMMEVQLDHSKDIHRIVSAQIIARTDEATR